ncbi:hypothetical protein [Xanthomonas hyacinthi]|nr:hypothetical protein [Xanthomonas hyacinthi]
MRAIIVLELFNRRLMEPLGHIPPAEAEAAYYSQIQGLAIAA